MTDIRTHLQTIADDADAWLDEYAHGYPEQTWQQAKRAKQLAGALLDVLELHERKTDCDCDYCKNKPGWCVACKNYRGAADKYPCATLRAIQAALDPSGNDEGDSHAEHFIQNKVEIVAEYDSREGDYQ